MKPYTRPIFRLILGMMPFLLLTGAFILPAEAGEVSVQATLSQPSASVGEAVEMEIKIVGARSGAAPKAIQVDGLLVNYNGESTSVQMNNFNVTMSVIHAYTVVPQRAGTFTIPAQWVDVDGKRYTTEPLTLTVGSSGANDANANSDGKNEMAFAELVIPKNKAYVGEVIPIELRVYVDSRIRWQMQQLPTINGDGFTTQKLTEPIRNQVAKNGHSYDLITFKTAITPIKMGHLGLGPVEINCIAQIPQKRKRPRFATDDFDSLFNDPFGGIFTQAQKLTIKIERNELDVRSLPPNAPKSFAGAVGTFSIATKATPTKVNVGDPITLTLAISGRGNFDRVNAPKLMEENGWRTYPASNKFKADDDLGISGSKTFEMAVIPEQVRSTLPLIEFSYFDPLTEKYVTLHADRDPVSIAAVQSPGSSPVSVAQASRSPLATPSVAAPTPSPAPVDIRYILTGPTEWKRSFESVYTSKLFWQLQIFPMIGLLAFTSILIARARKADLNALRVAGLREQKNQLLDLLRNESIDSKSFYDAAMKVLQLEMAGKLGSRTPSSIGLDDVCASLPRDEKARERVSSIFNTCDEYRYAGSETVAQKVSPEKRAEVMQTLKEFHPHADS